MHRLPLQGGLSSRLTQKPAMLGLMTAALFAASSLSSMAGTATFDFTADPTTTLIINGNNDQPWQASGGNPGGFLALTYPQNDQRAAIVFDDIDDGRLVKAFRFEADIRAGNPQGDRAADGFSVNFARGNDPYLADPTNVGGGFAGGGPAEFGTQTGIAVSFDTWSGNALPDTSDIEGIIVRVDNVTVNKTALAVRNGACEDVNSLQTGLRDAAFWADPNTVADPATAARTPESWDTLCWQPLIVDLDETGKLTVIWKGRTILDKFQTTYFPSVGQLVLAGRTGGANQHTHFDNIKLTTFQATQPIVSTPAGDSCGFTVMIADAGTISPVQSSITATLNGVSITPSITREDPNTRLVFSPATVLAPGSTNTVTVSFTTSDGGTINETRTYVVPAAVVFPATAATTQFTATSSGFTMRVHQLEAGRGPGDVNNIPNAENQLAGGFLNADGTPRENVAELSSATAGVFTVPIINFDQDGGSLGNFTGASDPARQDELIPGIPGTTGSTDNIAAEILTFLELKKGCHTLGFNSDDGFIATLGHSPFGPVLGSFGTGRGASDTLFRILVDQDGVYPVRVAWWEGGGGANLEFFSVVNGQKILINDPENPLAIKAYSAGRGPGVLQSIAPAVGWGGANPNGPVVITFRDDLTALNEASVVLNVDGQVVTPTKTDSGVLTTYRFAPTTPWAYGSSHTGLVTYAFAGGSTVTRPFSFGVRSVSLADFPTGFSIEGEHFDYNSGQHIAAVSTMPYEGGEYDTLGAVRDIDYAAPDNGPFEASGLPSSHLYRTGIPAEPSPSANRYVPMDSQLEAGTLDVQRPGGFEVTTNYKIGWAGNEWYNYTRVVPAGNYKVIGAQSHGESLANQRVARFGVVVAGAGTATQTVVPIGGYSEPGTGGWGNNALAVAKQNGQDTVVNLSGTQTLRVWIDSGDYDWFALIPTTEPTPPPSVTSASPLDGSYSVADALTLDVTDVLRSQKINFSTVRLTVNGTDVTSSAQITDTLAGVTVRYQPAGGFQSGTTYNYTLAFTDSSGAARTHNGSFTSAYNANVFVIEAEDLNHGSGQTVAAASTMPLTQGLYNGLGAVSGIDYNVVGDEAGEATYRVGETPNIPMNGGGNPDRGPFDVSPSYKIGWTSNGEWFNYTRTFPQGNFNVYAALSHGGGGPTAGSLQMVTAGATTTTQTLQELGTFNTAGGTGGWGVNRLVPLMSNGSLANVSLGGTQTVRMTMASDADFDYLLFVPTGAAGPHITSITRSGSNLVINWTGGGRLQATDTLGATANWQDVAGATGGTATVPITGAMRFFRVVQ